jgi:hypothetical protein
MSELDWISLNIAKSLTSEIKCLFFPDDTTIFAEFYLGLMPEKEIFLYEADHIIVNTFF